MEGLYEMVRAFVEALVCSAMTQRGFGQEIEHLRITVDGQGRVSFGLPFDKVDVNDVRALSGLLQQEPVLFGSVRPFLQWQNIPWRTLALAGDFCAVTLGDSEQVKIDTVDGDVNLPAGVPLSQANLPAWMK